MDKLGLSGFPGTYLEGTPLGRGLLAIAGSGVLEWREGVENVRSSHVTDGFTGRVCASGCSNKVTGNDNPYKMKLLSQNHVVIDIIFCLDIIWKHLDYSIHFNLTLESLHASEQKVYNCKKLLKIKTM